MRWLLSAVVMVNGRAALGLKQGAQFEAAGNVDRPRQHETVPNIFAGRAVVARPEGVQRIANSIHVIKQFAQHASPGLRFGKRVVRDQVEAAATRCLAGEASARCSWSDCRI